MLNDMYTIESGVKHHSTNERYKTHRNLSRCESIQTRTHSISFTIHGLYSPTILKNILTLVLSFILYLAAFGCNTTSDWVNHTVRPIRSCVTFIGSLPAKSLSYPSRPLNLFIIFGVQSRPLRILLALSLISLTFSRTTNFSNLKQLADDNFKF